MELERRLGIVARYHIALFLLPLLSLLYYGWWNADVLDQRPDNPLRLSPMALRGEIRDRHQRLLAESRDDKRVYPLGAAAGPMTGYHLRGRNQSGLEALLQSELSPPAPPKSLWGALRMDRDRQEGRPPLKGPSVALTLDATLQKSVYQALGGNAGAVVVAEAGTGEILAAVSGPSFDPNEIARDWQDLRSDPHSPLIERVGSGLYPVALGDGGALLTAEQAKAHPWLSDNPFPGYPGASSAVDIDGTMLVSPLMLLHTVSAQTEQKLVSPPRLLVDAGNEPSTAGPLPGLGEGERRDGFLLFLLRGPEFRESPRFQVLLGRGDSARALAFAVVLEDATEGQLRALEARLLPVLRSWQEGLDRSS